jgi:hypothetical protein
MRLPDGRELLARLAYPLTLDTAAALLHGIGQAAEEAGYTDVGYLYAGPEAGSIVGTPPPPGTHPGRGSDL